MTLEEFMEIVVNNPNTSNELCIRVQDEQGNTFVLRSARKPHGGELNPYYTAKVVSVSAVAANEFAVTVKTEMKKRTFFLMDDEDSENASFRPYGVPTNIKK